MIPHFVEKSSVSCCALSTYGGTTYVNVAKNYWQSTVMSYARFREKDSGMRIKSVFWIILSVARLVCHEVSAEPWVTDLKESEDPILVEARGCDLEFQPPSVADQKKCEHLYLQYVNNKPEDELVPYIYYRLGEMYTTRVTPKHLEAGAVRDISKAREYFLKSVQHYPKGRLGETLLNAHVNVAALAPTPEEQIRGYIEYYRLLGDLEKLSEKEVREKLWFSQRERKIASVKTDFEKTSVEAFLSGLVGKKSIAETNMVAIAEQSDSEMRLDLLRDITVTFPDSELGEKARASLRKFAERDINEAIESTLQNDHFMTSRMPDSGAEQSDATETEEPRSNPDAPVPSFDGNKDSSVYLWITPPVILGTAVILYLLARRRYNKRHQ